MNTERLSAMLRLKAEGKDLGIETRAAEEQTLFDAADRRIDEFWRKKREAMAGAVPSEKKENYQVVGERRKDRS